MRVNKLSVIVFLAVLVVALVSFNFILYSKLQFKDRFTEEKTFIKVKVRKRSLTIIIVKVVAKAFAKIKTFFDTFAFLGGPLGGIS